MITNTMVSFIYLIRKGNIGHVEFGYFNLKTNTIASAIIYIRLLFGVNEIFFVGKHHDPIMIEQRINENFKQNYRSHNKFNVEFWDAVRFTKSLL